MIHTNRSRMEANLNHTAIHSATEVGSEKWSNLPKVMQKH